MLGHPGISAFEYAGEAERHNHEKRVKDVHGEQKLFGLALWRDSTHSAKSAQEDDAAQSVVSSKRLECQLPQTHIEDCTIAQRRRGTFMNHTPRNHEVRSPTKLSHRQTSSEDLGRLYASYRGSSDDNANTSVSHSVQHSSYGSFSLDQSAKMKMNTSVELDSKEVTLNPLVSVYTKPQMTESHEERNSHIGKIMHPTSTVSPRPRRNQSSSAAASIKSSHTGISKRSLKKFLGGNTGLDTFVDHHPASFEEEIRPDTTASKSTQRPETANSKRRRRQTPYKLPKPIVTDPSRHAPLEPLVAHHRREVTGSDVDPLPPHVDIDNDISEAATLLAINEYFDLQELPRPVDSSMELSHPVKPATSKTAHAEAPSQSSISSSSSKHAPPIQDIDGPKESTPSLPERNPERLSRINSPINSHRMKSTSELSTQSDFTSAAKGQYSPYDERFDTVPRALLHIPLPPAIHARSTSSASGKLAPRIPGHDELASARLNDFNYFLRMTGPSPTNEIKLSSKKKKRGLRAMKVRSRKDSKNGMTSNSPNPSLPPPPACAREMTTSSGAKHLQIMIPTSDVSPNQTVSLPVYDAQGHSRRVSVTWTDELLQPLAGASVERAINPGPSTPASTTTQRSPKPAAASPKAVPVEDHPLLVSRKEQTRNRKLRDLKKAKEKVGVIEDDGDMEDKVARLEWLAGQLAEGLAKSAGIEGELLGPEEVLEAWMGMVREEE
ncbi:hypothetical protein N0V90_005516 [Kalmusia sp. IMI 367209]|nr:hypothetical protein N0V90_005516 [Kalmusia sp. IMI 367209]